MVKNAKNQDAYLDYGASPVQNKGCEQSLVPEQPWAAVHCGLSPLSVSHWMCFNLQEEEDVDNNRVIASIPAQM